MKVVDDVMTACNFAYVRENSDGDLLVFSTKTVRNSPEYTARNPRQLTVNHGVCVKVDSDRLLNGIRFHLICSSEIISLR